MRGLAQSIIPTITFCFFVVGCATTVNRYPDFSESDAHDSVVVGFVRSSRYLEQFEHCGEIDENGDLLTLCLDPPPFELRVEVLDRIFGAPTRRTLSVYTTSHYGRSSFETSRDHLYLFHLLSDGEATILPRYEYSALAFDKHGGLSVPMKSISDAPFWLPCSVASLHKRVHSVSPSSTYRFERDGWSESYFVDSERFVSLSDDFFRIVRGIDIDEIRRYLQGVDEITPYED